MSILLSQLTTCIAVTFTSCSVEILSSNRESIDSRIPSYTIYVRRNLRAAWLLVIVNITFQCPNISYNKYF